jgi:NitT/TauT family transport system substrate-binding protein
MMNNTFVYRKSTLLLFFIGLLLILLAGHTSAASTVTFLPQWTPQSQFAGYYVGYEKGIYEKYGIDLEILRGGPQNPATQGLVSGQADITTLFLSTGITNRAHGIKLINIAQIVQRSALILVAKKSSGIKSPADFHNKKISIWKDFDIQPKAFIRKFGLNVSIIPQTYTLNLFLRDGVDIASAMWYNEYHMILNSGYDEDELMTFFFDEYDLNFPEDGIYVLESTYQEHPDVCKNFVKASLEGWQYAFEHEQEALDIVMEYVNAANLPTNRVHQQWMLRRMKDIILPENGSSAFGELEKEEYRFVARELKKNGIIDTIPNFDAFYQKLP